MNADLKDNFRKDLSFDFNTGKLLPIPDPKLRDQHGTRCAGQIVSKINNGICGVGIAPDAQVLPFVSFQWQFLLETKQLQSRTNFMRIIYCSCSWGPADDGKAIDKPDATVLKSFIDGLVHGRNGKGSIYVFAAGNGKAVIIVIMMGM